MNKRFRGILFAWFVFILMVVPELGTIYSTTVADVSAKGNNAHGEIIGGHRAPFGAYPFMVAIEVTTNGKTGFQRQNCGGALVEIDPSLTWSNLVVTAAHCVGEASSENYKLTIGQNSLNSPQGITRGVKEVYRDHDFNNHSDAQDIAFLLLDRSVDTTVYPGIRLAGPDDDVYETEGTYLTVIGWGSVRVHEHPGHNKPPKYAHWLNEVFVPVASDETCDAAYARPINFSVTICAGKKHRDSCWGDSGGPLFAKEGENKFVLMGIVNAGHGCGDKDFFGTYAEVNSLPIAEFIALMKEKAKQAYAA